MECERRTLTAASGEGRSMTGGQDPAGTKNKSAAGISGGAPSFRNPTRCLRSAPVVGGLLRRLFG